MFKKVQTIFDTIGNAVTLSSVRNETKSMYIARPEHAVGQLIYLHPDKSIPRGSKITVRSDECALFYREGKFVARLNPGSELLDTANLPFLGHFLIDKFSDANHFICELFFVSMNECSMHSELVTLGQYRDLNSANVVAVDGRLSYTLRVKDPVTLINVLGGQSTYSTQAVQKVMDGRIFNQFRKIVGLRCLRHPIMDVVSNVDVEEISQEIAELATSEFTPLGVGIGRIYDLAMNLDSQSLILLRQFGQEESKLALQEKGSRIASREGFAEYNLIQGQRAALEGLGQGMSAGNTPMIMSTGGFGDLTRRGPSPVLSRSQSNLPKHGGAVLSGQPMFLLKSDRGDTGPFSARQIALMAISKAIKLEDLQIRSTQDPDDLYFSADLEPQILTEFKKRSPSAT